MLHLFAVAGGLLGLAGTIFGKRRWIQLTAAVLGVAVIGGSEYWKLLDERQAGSARQADREQNASDRAAAAVERDRQETERSLSAVERGREEEFRNKAERELREILDALADGGKRLDYARGVLPAQTQAALQGLLNENVQKVQQIASEPAQDRTDQSRARQQLARLDALNPEVRSFNVGIDTAIQTAQANRQQLSAAPSRDNPELRGSAPNPPANSPRVTSDDGLWSGDFQIFGGTVRLDLSVTGANATVTSRGLDSLVNQSGSMSVAQDGSFRFNIPFVWGIRGSHVGETLEGQLVADPNVAIPVTLMRRNDVGASPEFQPQFGSPAICDSYFGEPVRTVVSFRSGAEHDLPTPAGPILLSPHLLSGRPDAFNAFWWGHQCAHRIRVSANAPQAALAAARAAGISSDESLADCFALQKAQQLGIPMEAAISSLGSFDDFARVYASSMPQERQATRNRFDNLRSCRFVPSLLP